MIVESILNIVFGVVNIILAPISMLGWGLSPIITFIVAMFLFRPVIALIKTIWQLLPVL